MSNWLCERLGIKYPIVLGGMARDDRKFLMRYQSKIAPFFNVGI